MELLHLQDRAWIWLATLLYLAGFALGLEAITRRRRHSRTAMFLLIGLGFFCQSTGLYLRGLQVGGCPLGNGFEILQFVAWSLVVVYLTVGHAFRVSLLGFFSGALAALLSLASLLGPGWDATRRSHVLGGDPWIEFHAALALFSYGVFALLAMTALMYLIQSRSLRSHRSSILSRLLPSVVELEQVNYRLLLTGSVLLSVSLGLGSAHWLRNPEAAHSLKIGITGGIWLLALVLVVLRSRGLLFGRRLSWACLALFACALCSLAIVNTSRLPHPSQPGLPPVTESTQP